MLQSWVAGRCISIARIFYIRCCLHQNNQKGERRMSVHGILYTFLNNLKRLIRYFVNFTSDIFLGSIFAYMLERLFRRICSGKAFKQGAYINKEDNTVCYKIWFLQILTWFLILTLSKGSMVLLLVLIKAFRTWMLVAAEWLLSPLQSNPKLKLVFVMIIIPVILNILQNCFFD